MSREEPKQEGFALMGLKCWRCHGETGALCIPIDSDNTPQTIGTFLFSLRILPECENCIKSNPQFLSYETAEKGR